jgi:hypothetical protein
MKHALYLALLSLIIFSPARAQQYEHGTALLCDTQSQVERYVALFNGGSSLQSKLSIAKSRIRPGVRLRSWPLYGARNSGRRETRKARFRSSAFS